MLLPTVFSLLLLLLLSLLRGRYFLLPLPVVVSDTRCWCAAAVLRCCCLGPPIFPAIPPPGTTSPILPVLRHFLFVPPNSKLFRHFYISVSSSRQYACSLKSCSPRGRVGVCVRKLTALPRPVSLLPFPSPAPSPGYCSRLTCPLLRQITSTTRSPLGSRVLRPRLPYSTLAPPPPRPLPRLSARRS